LRTTARIILLSVLSLPSLACSREGAGASLSSDSADVAPPIIEPPPTPYQAATFVQTGDIIGTVELDGPPPRPDTVLAVTNDVRVCGRAAADSAVRLDGARLADVVIWLADARTGKPLPLERRYEIVNARCQLRPRVQAVVAGGTLNVRSLDPAIHHTLFRHAATGDTLALVSENDEGQVVPVEKIVAEPGMVRATCDLHPWTRGWIAVFDHPYFAVSTRRGSFSIDSIPPGRYRILAWHERAGMLEDSITVEPDQQTEIQIRFGGR
jgi:hypothetical protein